MTGVPICWRAVISLRIRLIWLTLFCLTDFGAKFNDLFSYDRRRDPDPRPAGSPRPNRQEHSLASGQETRPRGLQTLRCPRNPWLPRQALRQGEGTKVRACPWSQSFPRLQEVKCRQVMTVLKLCIRHQCRKTAVLSCHIFLINSGVGKNYKTFLNMDQNLNTRFLSESKCLYHRHKRIHRLLIGTACQPCFVKSSYVASCHLPVAPLSGAKQIFYCTVYYITLNSNWSSESI